MRVTKEGFTLVEILIAILILAISLTALLKSLQTYTLSTKKLEKKILAEIIAMNLINDKTLISHKEGEISFAGDRWSWHAHSHGTDNPTITATDISVKSISFQNVEAYITGYESSL